MMPKRIITTLLCICAAMIVLGFIRADDDPIKKIVTQLSKWIDTNPQEKVYLQTDKPYYAAGEDIWFKAYITIGEKHHLSALGNILYVDLINDKDSVQRSIKLPVSNGISWGDFNLPDSLKAGNYRLRAYTNYMRNDDAAYFFDKTLVIGNSVNNSVFTKTTYTYSTVNGQQKVSAAITYTELNGAPYAGKEVSYEVQADAKTITRGRGTTDANGLLNVNFTSNANAKPERIMSTIKYADKKLASQTIPVKAVSDKIDLQFFPEGGNMVNGLRSKIGFKATGGDGLGVGIKGVIKDNAGNDVAVLSPAHFGMGYAIFAPEAGKTYKAVITNPDGSSNNVALPPALDKGFTLNIANNDPANIIIKIGASADMINTDNSINVVAQQNGHVYYAAQTKIKQAVFSATVPKNRFPTGIVQVTLFSSTGEPLNERVIFIQNPDLLKLDVNTDSKTYAPRQKVKLTLDAHDATDKPVVGSFSATVIDEGKVPNDETTETTILSSLLLTSDLKGYIEKPNYYFINPTDETASQLDALMLTQGYRRFVWKQILNDVFASETFKAEKSIVISGTIKSGSKPVPKAKVTLFATAGGPFILDTVADDAGHFAFHNMVFKDSTRFLIQARNAKGGKNVEIEIDNIGAPAIGKNKNAPDIQVNINSVLANYLQNSKDQYLDQVKFGVGNHVTLLKEVVITEKKKPIENSSNLNGPGNADQIIKADQLETCPSLDICLTGRLNFVNIHGGKAYSNRSPSTPMLIVVDGVTMGDDFTLDNLNAADVETIEVLRTIAYTSIYGTQGGGGVLLITTKRGGGDRSFVRYAPGVVTFAPKGYYRIRDFYAPKYDDPKTNPAMADLRSTICWKPNIITDKDGKAGFEFFNADGKGTYKVIVEGIDNDGNLGRQVYRYKVE